MCRVWYINQLWTLIQYFFFLNFPINPLYLYNFWWSANELRPTTGKYHNFIQASSLHQRSLSATILVQVPVSMMLSHREGFRSLVLQLNSPSLISNMNMMCEGFLKFFFFQINGGNIKIHTVQRKHIIIIFIYSQFYATVSDYRAVRLSSHLTTP